MENYSLNSRGIKQAALQLINENATDLIEYIYRKGGMLVTTEKLEDNSDNPARSTPGVVDEQNRAKTKSSEKPLARPLDKELDKHSREEKKPSIFENPEVRIGLCIRILAKTERFADEALVNLILEDIEALRRNSDYLLSFKDPKSRKAALDEEYALVQGYIDMDDTISLNQETETQSRIGKLASDGGCTIV